MAENEKIYMLNALWFKPEGGAAKYAEYAAAAAPFVRELGGRMLDGFIPEQSLIGEWEPDLFFIVEWPSLDAFLQLPQNPGYQAIASLREEALRDSLVIRCKRTGMPT